MPVRLIQKVAYGHKREHGLLIFFFFFCNTKEMFYEKLNLNKFLSDRVFQSI